MSNKSKVISCLVCDVARKEAGGKDALFGVYPNSMKVQELPAILPAFAIWFEMQPKKTKFDAMEIAIFDPDNKKIIEVKGKLEISETNDSIGVPVQFGNISLQKTGRYTIKIGLDEPMKKVKEFFVYGPSNTEKKKRLKGRSKE
jgi:hypothetical protein